MSVLNMADALRVGSSAVDKVYAGTDQVWPASSEPGGSSYDDLVLSHGPALFVKLDETTGATAADSSGFGRHATHEGSPTLGQASLLGSGVGKSVQYTGGSGTRSVVPYGAWMNQQSFYIEARIIAPSADAWLVSRWHGTGSAYIFLWSVTAGKLTGCVTINGNTSPAMNAVGATTLTPGQPYTVGLLRTPAAHSVVLNGIIDGTNATAGTHDASANAASTFEFGSAADALYSVIRMSRVSFTPTALTSDQLAARHAAAIAT